MKRIIIPVMLGLWIFISNSLSLQKLSSAYDENVHWLYGIMIGKGDSDRLYYPQYVDDSKMPITSLNAIPCLITGCYEKHFSNFKFIPEDMTPARMITVFFSIFLAFLIFFWAKRMYGYAGGCLSMFLYAFCPNLQAFSQLISTDVYAAGFAALAIYLFYDYQHNPDIKRLILSALGLGLAQLAKYGLLFLYPSFLIIVLLKYFRGLAITKTPYRINKIFFDFWHFLIVSMCYVLISILVINAGFLCNKTFSKVRDFKFYSKPFLHLQNQLYAQNLSVPLPYPYIQGLDRSIFNVDTGSSIGNTYLLGELREARTEQYQCFNGYYFIVSLFKVPIATQIIILLSIWFYIKKRRDSFWDQEIYLIVPVILVAFYLNYFYKMQIGIRYLLMIFPLIYIFCGNLMALQPVRISFGFYKILGGLILYLMISVCFFYPFWISYTNEFIPDKKQAYKIMADSNLDFAIYRKYLKEFLKTHPEIHYQPSHPDTGIIVVGVNELTGVFEKDKFLWLRKNFEPVGTFAYSYLIYNITPEDLAGIKNK